MSAGIALAVTAVVATTLLLALRLVDGKAQGLIVVLGGVFLLAVGVNVTFSEKWVGRSRPSRFEHVFASIQSLSHANLASLDPGHFDVMIVDEFHHAAAPSYQALLEHVRPRELLGMTATPERADGLDVLRYFDGRIAAELWVTEQTVKFHLSNIYRKLDVANRTEASRWAQRNGLLNADAAAA